MTDNDFLLALLQAHAGKWVSQAEVLRRSEQARGCGMTVHSRAPELRTRGHVVENKVERRNGRAVSFYRLVLSTPEESSACAGLNPRADSPSSGVESTLFDPVSGRARGSRKPEWA